MSPTEAIFVSLVAQGVFSIDQYGYIWRHANRQNGGFRIRPARRAEYVTPRGYLKVHIPWNGTNHSIPAHRLVWLTKVGPIPKGRELNHKDNNPQNNNPDNLELVTHARNVQHATELGMHPNSKLNQAKADIIRAELASGRSRRDIAAAFNISRGTVYNVATGKSWA